MSILRETQSLFEGSPKIYSNKKLTQPKDWAMFYKSLTSSDKLYIDTDYGLSVNNIVRVLRNTAHIHRILVIGRDYGSIVDTLAKQSPKAHIDLISHDMVSITSCVYRNSTLSQLSVHADPSDDFWRHNTYQLIIINDSSLNLPYKSIVARRSRRGLMFVYNTTPNKKIFGTAIRSNLGVFFCFPSSLNATSIVSLDMIKERSYSESLLKAYGELEFSHKPGAPKQITFSEFHRAYKQGTFESLDENIINVFGGSRYFFDPNQKVSIWQHSRSDKTKITTTINIGLRGFAFKRAESPDGIPHIHNMVKNYHILTKKLSSSSLIPVRASLMDNSCVKFPYINGVNLESKVYQLLTRGDYDGANRIIQRIFGFLDSFSHTVRQKEITSNSFFTSYKNASHFLDVGVVDLNLNNFILKSQKYYLIDYEWVVDEEIPLNFVKTRLLFYFFYQFNPAFKADYSSDKNWIEISNELFIPRSTQKLFNSFLTMPAVAAMHKSEATFQRSVTE